MKRAGNLWPRTISFYNLARSAELARRRKRSRPDVQLFEFDLERNLWQLHEELASKSYRPGPYHTFTIYEPKKRLISASPYRDRVVHHALTAVLERVFDDDKRRLGCWRDDIRRFLGGLRLRLHPRKSQLFPIADGVRFLGYRVFPWRRTLARENVRRFRRRVRRMQAGYASGELSADQLRTRLVSWLGHARQGSGGAWREALFATIAFRKGDAR